MTIESRIRELGNRHRSLESAIRQEAGHPSADSLHLKALKLQKLRLKDQINALQDAR
ncbi:MAG: DUF465 domain-containing protein [Alphaproteobacteria bacterium]|nr:DUF465 domain-containing protein [Alphaproteobacteria bacterium]MBU1527257.1 DUF465 domain-containing protein [Alphaproteobacteria bacterium]MBU2116556.1 DUF465 domain-containing protein [Alphaproteobacteria bacterium]MBU2350344.1 DUF465 domain-containing protein [Alphaproteobacteria bacterium]MBU2383496.1 DUF465 domain-containing protein [Alphaproteobacteria bacterium]